MVPWFHCFHFNNILSFKIWRQKKKFQTEKLKQPSVQFPIIYLATLSIYFYLKLTLCWKYIEQFNLVSKCCHSRYSSTLACCLLSVGYQWSSTFFSRHRYRSIPTLRTNSIIFCILRLSKPQGLLRLEGLGKLKKFNDLIQSQTRDLPSCSIVPQPTTLSHAPFHTIYYH
jgi:hypothetical protein